jgi:FKBP-type peptidyl-prolyl cis-trans isomerase FklB
MRKIAAYTMAVFLLSLGLVACGGEKSDAGSSELKTFNDSVNYAIGVKSATNLERNKLAIKDQCVKGGIDEVMNGQPAEKIVLKDKSDSVCYSLGKSISKALMGMKFEINPAIIVKAMADVKDKKQLITDANVDRILANFQQLQTEQIAQDNGAEGRAFMTKHATEEGVIVTPSGIHYKIVKSGTGKTPGMQDNFVCNYRGTLLNGKEFDSSFKTGKPANFPVYRMIQGWQEILQMMKVGDSWEIWIPSELAYGAGGYPPDIGPNATLKFELELLDVIPAPAK